MCTDVVKAPNPSVGLDAIEGTRHAFQVLRALVIANPGDATRVHKGSNGDHGNGSSGSIVVIFSFVLPKALWDFFLTVTKVIPSGAFPAVHRCTRY